jgi:hypothetical protein
MPLVYECPDGKLSTSPLSEVAVVRLAAEPLRFRMASPTPNDFIWGSKPSNSAARAAAWANTRRALLLCSTCARAVLSSVSRIL